MENPAEKNDCALDHYIIVHRLAQDKASAPPLIPDEWLRISTDFAADVLLLSFRKL